LLDKLSNSVRSIANILSNQVETLNTQKVLNTKLYVTAMNIVERSKDKYASLSTNTVENKFLFLITENYKVLKELSNNSLRSGIMPGEIINRIIPFSENNQQLVQLIEEYFKDQKYHNLKICLAATHRICIQINLIASRIEMNHKIEEIPQNYLGLLIRSWSCYIPIVLEYLFNAFHPESPPLIVLYS